MSNSLTTRTTLGLIPLYVGVLLRHYYYKLVKDKSKTRFTVPLRREELMYDEAFSITRVSYGAVLPLRLTKPNHQNLMDAATRYTSLPSFITTSVLTMVSGSHTVEEMQKFAQIHTPIPPSEHVVRVSVPLSSCAEAARLLIDVFGGEVEAKRVLGGVRWWQVRADDKGCVFVLVLSCEVPLGESWS